jgi:D-alanyl-D-alanine carboxypeptidase
MPSIRSNQDQHLNGFLSTLVGFLLFVLLPTLSAQAQGGGAGEALHQRWADAASRGLDPRAVAALQRIHGADRRLLAIRAYLRAGDSLSARWSWSQDTLTQYPSTPEGKAAATDIDSVVAAFAKANPGYELQVNRQPRSLEVQLEHWNENASVTTLAASLVGFLEQRFAATASPSTGELQDALVHWVPDSAAALAAPGLSAHGQGRAFDFAVTHRGQLVAGIDAASAGSRWDSAGWTRKLHAAVAASGKPFVGPLQSPYEPWHYAYTPPSSGEHP